MGTKVAASLLVCLLLPSACVTGWFSGGQPPYKNADLPVDVRVDDLLSRMTLEEKVAQLLCNWPQAADPEHIGKGIIDDAGCFNPEGAREVLAHGIGQIARPSEAKDVAATVRFINRIQHFLLAETRLGIPAMFHEEGLHGHMARGATSFPQAIALSCTWDPDLVERVFAAVAREIRIRGAQQALTPVLDVCRDPRWGRTEETYGEDPYLASRMGVACIRGFQGRDSGPGTRLANDRVIATAKHFAVHGQPEGGINCAPANYSERKVREVFLPSFEAAVREAGVRSVMASYNEVDGIPVHANRRLLVDVLRKEWGFQGFVVSDYYGIEQLRNLHHVVADDEAAGLRALAVGVDIELPDPKCYAHLVAAAQARRVPVKHIDRAVRRILQAKFEAGCFERPFADSQQAEAVINCEAHRELALEAARKAVVLLQNEGGVLPLDASRLRSIAVIGPNADRVMLGGYTDQVGPGRTVTVLAGIRAWLQARAGDRVEVLYAEGCRITEPEANWFVDNVKLSDPAEDTPRIEAAVVAASKADVTVLVLGGNEATCREGWSTKHLGDRDSLDLLGRQQELVDRVVAIGKPVVVVLLNGRPLTMGKVVASVPAILEGWYLGQEGGTALAEILFGDVNPSGKLSITFPRSVGQIPAHYSHKPSARRGYLLADKAPLFPFGHGLSYTSFEYQVLRLSPDHIGPQDTIAAVVQLRNTGDRPGTEVVQLYVRDKVSTVTRPVLELRGFARVALAPGASRTVRFYVTPAMLAGLGLDNRRTVEPGEFEIFVAGSSAGLVGDKTAGELTTSRPPGR
ncbi:MAG: glycoside hydrolase family 3 N-terminal domain-containing protein, partial [Planctomycetota bacterium]